MSREGDEMNWGSNAGLEESRMHKWLVWAGQGRGKIQKQKVLMGWGDGWVKTKDIKEMGRWWVGLICFLCSSQ